MTAYPTTSAAAAVEIAQLTEQIEQARVARERVALLITRCYVDGQTIHDDTLQRFEDAEAAHDIASARLSVIVSHEEARARLNA